MNKKCEVCGKLFSPVRKLHFCCSKECNHKKQKLKEKIKNRERLNSIQRFCKNDNCIKKFTPNRNNQLFCSEICADRQGKRDWKKRNSEIYMKMERDRKRNKYQNDLTYRESRKEKSNKRFHNLSPEEKLQRSRDNRSARDPEDLKKYHREYFAERIKKDINFLLISNLRTLTKGAIKRGGTETETKTIKLIGCSLEECREHIENQFDEKMDWTNWDRDGWHLDHIRPCSSFNMFFEEQQYVCFNWRNLQPLWWYENINKKDNYQAHDEENWEKIMRDLGYEGELFLKFRKSQISDISK